MATPTATEQLNLELINRARTNPTAEASLYGIDLNADLAANTISTDAKQPLAFYDVLNDSADTHSSNMLALNFFSHTGQDGTSSGDRMFAAGWTSADGGYTLGENISFRGSTGSTIGLNADTIESHHSGLFQSAGHRVNMLNGTFAEIGVGQQVGSYTTDGIEYTYSSMLTENYAEGGRIFITGVVINDADGDAFYDIGEGLGSITVTAVNTATNASISTTTWDAGGYSLQAADGTYEVTYSGSALSGAITKTVTVAGSNVKVDALSSEATTSSLVSSVNPGSNSSTFEVYRFFNTQTGTHFFTASTDERDSIIANIPTFSYEGNAFDSNANTTTDLAVHRFYKQSTGTHFYTASEDERQQIVNTLPDYQYESIVYYAHATEVNGTTGLHRFFNTTNSEHFYTSSEAERDEIQATLSHYQYEGIAYYVDIA